MAGLKTDVKYSVHISDITTYTTLNFNAELFDLEQTMHFNQREGPAPN